MAQPGPSPTFGEHGQTASQVRGLLAAAGLSPRRRFGQNFLIDLNLMRKLVASAELRPADVVLEVGGGTGSLTELLLATGSRVVTAEVDVGLQGILSRRLGDNSRFQLHAGDALDSKHQISAALLNTLRATRPEAGGNYKLVANLPYNIATPLIVELLRFDEFFERLCFTVQAEMADRLIAQPRTHDYGPVSIIVQLACDVEFIARVPPTAFWPRPLVDSAIVRLRPRPNAQPSAELVTWLHQAFQQRRKMLRQSLKSARVKGTDRLAPALSELGLTPEARPEELSPRQWLDLARRLGP